jgi:hypothetical protein
VPKQLSETAQVILATAGSRDNLHVLPLATSLKAPAVVIKKTLEGLLKQDLVSEVQAGADDPVWSYSEEAGKTTLVVTTDGLRAVGIGPEDGEEEEGEAKVASRPARRAAKASSKAPSKQDTCISLLNRRRGVTIPEMMEATGWQAHSVRGFISGALKKRLKLEVNSRKEEGGERYYFIAKDEAAE